MPYIIHNRKISSGVFLMLSHIVITYNGHYYALNYEVKINEKLFNELYTRSMISKVCSMLLGCIWNMGLWDIIILFTLA